MSTDLNLQCDCGRFQAVASGVTPGSGNHTVCYCDDCQAFQHFLGSPERVLDANGGTDLFQMSCGRLRIISGEERLACIRFSPKGPLRWYASCCNAAIGNTLASAALPFVGVITARFDRVNESDAVSGALGPRRRGVFGRFAYGDRTQIDAHDKIPLPLVLRFLRLAAGWRLRGDHKRSPLFDAATGDPTATPATLPKSEREKLERTRLALRAEPS